MIGKSNIGIRYISPKKYLQAIYASTADPITYTYTVPTEGTYLAAGVRGDGGGSISTSGGVAQVIQAGSSSRTLMLQLIYCKPGNTITISANNFSGGAYRGNNIFLGKLSDKKITCTQVAYKRGSDTTVSVSAPVATDINYITVQMSCGSSRSGSRSIAASCLQDSYSTDAIYIGFILGQNNTISLSQSGNTAGGPTAFIGQLN